MEAQAAAIGFCGTAKWTYEDGTLTISGGIAYAYTKDGTNPYGWDVYRDEITTVIVEEGMQILGWDTSAGISTETLTGNCFRDYINLKTVQLPSTLQLIGYGCFAGCTALTKIIFPENIQLQPECFMGSGLTDVVLPTSVAVDRDVFRDTPFLATLGDFVMFQEGKLYAYQGTERTVTIPEGVTSIYPFAFQDNTNVTHVRLPSTLLLFNAAIFEGCTNLCQLTIPPEINTFAAPAPSLSLPEIIYGETGSAAEAFAKQNNLHFIDPNDYTDLGGTDMTLDFSKDVWSFGNSSAVFGDGYFLTEAAAAKVVEQWLKDKSYLERAWNGSCYGLSATVVLAKAGMLPITKLQPNAVSLIDVEPNTEVLSVINYYHYLPFDNTIITADDMHNKSQRTRLCQLIYDMKAVPTGGSPSVVSYETSSGGQHAVVAYGLEEGNWTWDGVTYHNRILIWDSNFHTTLDDRACLYYDSDTLNYCIPYYGVMYAKGFTEDKGKIIGICNRVDLMNAYSYPYPSTEIIAGDANGDGVRSVADAVMLAKFLTCQGNVFYPQSVDLDGNNQLNANDLSLLKRLLQNAG